jgi:hypothetical protein
VARIRAFTVSIAAVALGSWAAGCGVSFAPLPAGSVAGRIAIYDYSPSVIQSGNLQQVWWCGQNYNPEVAAQFTDTIQYESIDLASGARQGPMEVLAETPGAWDSVYTCNPKVVRGTFANPLGNGETFTYAMYYVGLGPVDGTNNSIGVAFSNDGISWKKYPQPVITAETQDNYGVGQPALYNNQRGTIRMFYEDNSYDLHHVEAISSDGVHFNKLGTLTANGLDPNSLAWGDMAYDPQTGYWYAGFNTNPRVPSTTGGFEELGAYGISLYRITDAALLTGSTPWELLTNIDTSLNGYEENFIPGFVRDMYGNLLPGPTIKMFTSISNPPPPWNASPFAAGFSGDTSHWNISSAEWTSGHPLLALNRYFNQTTHEVTTGWIDPNGGFVLQSTLGHLYQSPQQGATFPLYSCKLGNINYFISRDSACEGYLILGTVGYGYPQPVSGANLVPLYRCRTSDDHFVSTDPNCEGYSTDELLGYALP